MDDNKNQNQSKPNISDYQKILDEYAASVKPEDVNPSDKSDNPDTDIKTVSLKEAPVEPQINKIPEVEPDITEDIPVQSKTTFLKTTNSPQLESPIHPSLSANLDTEDVAENNLNTTKLPPKPETKIIPNVDVSNKPNTEKTPEEIKAEINRLLADDNQSTSSSGPSPVSAKSGSGFSKTLFAFALILFLTVAAGLAYFLFLVPQNSTNTNNKSNNSATSTITPTKDTCELNDTTYQVGESFASSDGCNTCTCSSGGMIACTEKACTGTVTPINTTPSATKSATTSSIPKDWKTYEDKEIGFSFNYPKNITLTKKISNGVFSLSINNSQAFAGGINIITGITINRGGSGLDFGGYTKEGSQISYVFDKDRSVTCTSKTIQKIYKNQNNIEIVILSGLNNPNEDGMLAPCETISGDIQALINTQNKTYPGIAFITSSLITESDLLKILDTFKFN